MNPFDKQSFMTPAAYMFLALPLLIIFCKWKWEDGVNWFLYIWFMMVFVVAFLWNTLYLWKEDE